MQMGPMVPEAAEDEAGRQGVTGQRVMRLSRPGRGSRQSANSAGALPRSGRFGARSLLRSAEASALGGGRVTRRFAHSGSTGLGDVRGAILRMCRRSGPKFERGGGRQQIGPPDSGSQRYLGDRDIRLCRIKQCRWQPILIQIRETSGPFVRTPCLTLYGWSKPPARPQGYL